MSTFWPFWKDLSYAGRVLRKAPGFTAVVLSVLAIGIGANGAIFSLLDAVLLRALPFQNPDELMSLWEQPPNHRHNRVSPLNFEDWREQNHSFSSMAAIAGGAKTLLTAGGNAERIPGQSVTTGFFDVLGVRPVVGRTFTSGDARLHSKVVVLSKGLWKRRFGSDPKLIGKTVILDSEPFTVVGIVPERFQIFWESELWTPFYPTRSPEQRQEHYLRVIGRLRKGLNADQAGSDMARVAANIARMSPATNKGWTVAMEPLRDSIVGDDLRTTSLVLCVAVGFVLLIAGANVANLLLVRGAGKAREIAVRVSLGATRSRILSQLLSESLLLAVIGGTAGAGFAYLIIRSAPAFLPAGTLPAGLSLSFNGRLVAYVSAVVLVIGVLCGLGPVWEAGRIAVADALRAAGRTHTGSAARIRSSLAASEVAISVTLAIGAGLLLRTLETIRNQDPGYHADRVLTMYVGLPLQRYPEPRDALRFYQSVEGELAALPGVRSVGLGTTLPLDGWDIGQGFRIVGETPRRASEEASANYQMVSAGYFKTLGIGLLSGRGFTEEDTSRSTPVCVINEELARRYFRGQRPIGRRLIVHAMDPAGPKPVMREIVGVIRQVKVQGLAERENALEIYVPITQNAWYSASIAVATAGRPLSFVAEVKRAIAKVDREQPVTQVRTMDEVSANSIAQPRFRAELLGSFALWALLLAAVGVFSVITFSVAQRTREFGVRMAVGAATADIVGMVIGDGLKIAAVGVGIGLAAAGLLTRLLASFLYGVTPTDAATFAAAPVLMSLVAIASGLIPALHASRTNPATVLRQE